jgi:hypothetical protein
MPPKHKLGSDAARTGAVRPGIIAPAAEAVDPAGRLTTLIRLYYNRLILSKKAGSDANKGRKNTVPGRS